MGSNAVKAIRDWCKTTFQQKGSYVTSEALNQKGYLTEVPVATDLYAGGVKPDGTTIIMDSDGTIHAVGGGGGTSGLLETYTDQTVAVPYTFVNKDSVTEEEIEWNQGS